MNLTDKNFEIEVLNTEIPVLVDFWGSWCPPCKIVEPIIEKLAKTHEHEIKVCKMNVDRYPEWPSRYNIQGLPTFIIFWKGKEIDRCFAARSENQLRKMIEISLDTIQEKSSTSV